MLEEAFQEEPPLVLLATATTALQVEPGLHMEKNHLATEEDLEEAREWHRWAMVGTSMGACINPRGWT